MDENLIAEHIRTNPPQCVSGFQLTKTQLPNALDDNFTTAFRLTCKCGNRSGKILGHRLRDYNSNCDVNDDALITPLGFQCGECNVVTEIIDTDVHGYHAEIAKLEGGTGSAKIRGDGSRTEYQCPNCSGKVFNDITVGFVYWDFEIMLDEPELPGQDFFNVFLIYTRCQDCGHTSRAIDLGKL